LLAQLLLCGALAAANAAQERVAALSAQTAAVAGMGRLAVDLRFAAEVTPLLQAFERYHRQPQQQQAAELCAYALQIERGAAAVQEAQAGAYAISGIRPSTPEQVWAGVAFVLLTFYTPPHVAHRLPRF
jgi:hypothetical protein